MAEWNRFKEDKKYTVAQDTNVNPKHVGEPLRKLTLEDRMEIRRIARENSNKLSDAFQEETTDAGIVLDVLEDDGDGEEPSTGPADTGGASEPSQAGKRTLSEDISEEIEPAGKKSKTAEDELDLEVVGQVVVEAEAIDAAKLVEDLDAAVRVADNGVANGTKDGRKLVNAVVGDVVSINDDVSGKPSKDVDAVPQDVDAVVELDVDATSARAAARAGAERRARRKAKSSSALTVPSPLASPSPDSHAEVEVLE